jgi:hypothetical protein
MSLIKIYGCRGPLRENVLKEIEWARKKRRRAG